MLTVFFEYRIVFSSLNQLIITLDNIIIILNIFFYFCNMIDIDKNLQKWYNYMKNIRKFKICAKYFPLHHNI